MCGQVYILFSKKTDKFYVGFTSRSIDIRFAEHLDKAFKGCFTAQANDWELFLEIKCESVRQGLRIEQHIKQMKSKKYIQNLKRYPEMIQKLLNRYKAEYLAPDS